MKKVLAIAGKSVLILGALVGSTILSEKAMEDTADLVGMFRHKDNDEEIAVIDDAEVIE